MKNMEGWVREKLHQSVNKLIVVRNMSSAESGSKPRYRVVAAYYYGPSETVWKVTLGGHEYSFPLRIDNELYYRSETQVNVLDIDTNTYLSFSQALVLGISPQEHAQWAKTQQMKKLLDERKKDEKAGLLIVAVAVGALVVGVAIGVFLGYYLTMTGSMGAIAPVVSPSPTPIWVPSVP